TPSTLYEVQLTYVCRTTDSAAFDYLATPSDADNASLTTAPGPARREDASIPVPDDSAISFDGAGRRFKAWGASFQQTPEGPLPESIGPEAEAGKREESVLADALFSSPPV